jgi:hypothetical protein
MAIPAEDDDESPWMARPPSVLGADGGHPNSCCSDRSSMAAATAFPHELLSHATDRLAAGSSGGAVLLHWSWLCWGTLAPEKRRGTGEEKIVVAACRSRVPHLAFTRPRQTGKGSSSGQGGDGVACCTAASRRPPRAYGLGRGRTKWHLKCRFCPYRLPESQVCHRVSLLALPPYTTDETWKGHWR